MAHVVTPLGKWKKEVSWNDPDVMFHPEGGHENQITPQDYIQEREMETQGDTVLDQNGKINRRKLVNKLVSIMQDDMNNYDYQQRLQMMASENPIFGARYGGMLDFAQSQEMDHILRMAKANGQLDNYNNFHQPIAGSQIQLPNQMPQNAPPMSSMQMNMQRISHGDQFVQQAQNYMHQQPQYQPQYQPQPQPQFQNHGQINPMTVVAGMNRENQGNSPQITPKKIRANREQLKQALAQNQQNTMPNHYNRQPKVINKGS